MIVATITKRFTFDAAHRLDNLPANHKCHRLHGHTYEVELLLCGPVDEHTGFVVDYANIALAWEPLHRVLDHGYLNDIGRGDPLTGFETIRPLPIPSTENLAFWIGSALVDAPELYGPRVELGTFSDGPYYAETTLLTQVIVRESSTTECRFDVAQVSRHRAGARRPWHTVGLRQPSASAPNVLDSGGSK